MLNLWRVKVGISYRRSINRGNPKTQTRTTPAIPILVVVRTTAGDGTVVVKGSGHHLTKNTLFVFDKSLLEAYHTSGTRWHFWWAELIATDALHFPMCQVIRIAAVPHEAARCEEVFALLQSSREEQRYLATAAWQHLFFEWRAAARVADNRFTSADLAVQRMLEAMKRKPGEPWPLAHMAKAAGMSPSTLRNACRKLLGSPPARLRLQVKLNQAYEFLRRGDRNVAEVAEALGFCDPFHFSKAFKRQFGYTPSETQSRAR